MTIRLGQLALKSKDKILLSNFLSDLLEMEISQILNSVRLTHPNFSILIMDDENPSDITHKTMVDFFVETEEALDEISTRLEFIKYRFNLPAESKAFEEIRKFELDKRSYFFMTDPDGRKWKFTVCK